jgi:rubrerythrin
VGSTEENLERAFQNEISANVEEYPKLIKDAGDEGAKGALSAFSQARDVESRHADLYKKAMSDMLADRQTDYYVCQSCGYISEDEAPEKCPICGAVKTRFKLMT